jgi:hypothetical protein
MMIDRCFAMLARSCHLVTTLLLIGALSGCAGPAREPLDSLSELQDGETLVVGRVELVPALRKEEQRIKGLNSGAFENKLFLIIDETFRVLTGRPQVADFNGRIEAVLGKDFFVRSKTKPFFILGGMLYLDVGGSEMNRAYFPGGMNAAIKPTDKAVYIGTLQYHRNEFFEVSKVVIVDDYDRVNAEFKKKFGVRLSLRKALLTQVK